MDGKGRQSGQVLLVGVIMMVVLLIAMLVLFDVHNVIRAKLKTETAQQAAALTGAEWQKESLNLIGEINLIKACETMLSDDDRFPGISADLPEDPDEPKAEGSSLFPYQARIELLTEMQTRVSFLGPLIGFAAAQQAAKQNGLPPHRNLDDYLGLLEYDSRYTELGQAPEYINNYRWKKPYLSLTSAISDGGIAVYPNARIANTPIVDPSELAEPEFYSDIVRHAGEIAAGDPPEQSSWHDNLYRIVKNWRQENFKEPWWRIDYSMADFPQESEIYTLGVTYAAAEGDYESIRQEAQSMMPDQSLFSYDRVPVALRWCRYDRFWYPAYYEQYDSYREDHYDYWFSGGALREKVKPEYIYEGPAAYAEGYVDVDTVSRHSLRYDNRKAAADRRIRDVGIRSIRVGSRRTTAEGSDLYKTDYRPGAIAKPLGKLSGQNPPITIPVILPVFETTALMPTYMPIPYGFGVLRIGTSYLERFLSWLSDQSSLAEYEGEMPGGTGGYLEALITLTDGPGFRYYGWNPDFDSEAFDTAMRADPDKLFDRTYVYRQHGNPSGAGWLQEPQLFTLDAGESADETRVADHVNGGTATRVFEDGDSTTYYVIDSKGHVVTNDEADPTRLYHNDYGGGGPGYEGNYSKPDTQKGPPRL